MMQHGPGARRFTIIVVLVVSMVLTLFGRLYYLQLLDPNKPQQTAGLLHDGVIVVPAPRGLIVDARGRPLVDNTSVQVLTIDQDRLEGLPDHGEAVLGKLAALLGVSASRLAEEIRPCSPKVPAPCWTGEPYQPVPVVIGVPTQVLFTVSEHREDFPGVSIETQTLPNYPDGTLAAHLLGYVGQVTEADKKSNAALVDADTIGVAGLEQQYDDVLRGVDGGRTVRLSPQGYAVSEGPYRPPVQGDTLVTSIDARIQTLAEQSLLQQLQDSQKAGKPAPSGAVVVMDPLTGRIVAAASYPTYDPQLFVGGISTADYGRLTSPAAQDPLLSRAIAGQYAPGSTFKLITTSSLVSHHEISLDGQYPCPSALSIDGRIKTNFESESFGGAISLRDALGYSCDTFFYAPAANEYYADQNRIDRGEQPHEWLQHMAASYGVGTAPGVDLPADEQASGSYADRATRLERWRANRVQYCRDARRGYPEIANTNYRSYLTQLASENCTDGWRYRAGDNADLSIGQGETTLSPLQLAIAYSALVNGGRIWEPRLGWAVVDKDGNVAETIQPKVRSTVPVSAATLRYIADSLNFGRGWAVSGAFAYLDSPYRARIGGKTGTAEVYGKQDTSWLATWGPIKKDSAGNVRAKFVMVGMVEQAGTGATAAGPMLKRIWDGIFGVGRKAIVSHASPVRTLPDLGPQVRVSK